MAGRFRLSFFLVPLYSSFSACRHELRVAGYKLLEQRRLRESAACFQEAMDWYLERTTRIPVEKVREFSFCLARLSVFSYQLSSWLVLTCLPVFSLCSSLIYCEQRVIDFTPSELAAARTARANLRREFGVFANSFPRFATDITPHSALDDTTSENLHLTNTGGSQEEDNDEALLTHSEDSRFAEFRRNAERGLARVQSMIRASAAASATKQAEEPDEEVRSWPSSESLFHTDAEKAQVADMYEQQLQLQRRKI